MDADVKARIHFMLDKAYGCSVNMDAPRRIDISEPKSSSWTLRELLKDIINRS